MVTQIRRNKFFERIIEFNDLKKADPLINNFVNTKSKIVLLSLVFGFVLIQYLLSQVKFFLPDNPVPITLQTFGILMLGSLYGLRLTLASITVYLVFNYRVVIFITNHKLFFVYKLIIWINNNEIIANIRRLNQKNNYININQIGLL